MIYIIVSGTQNFDMAGLKKKKILFRYPNLTFKPWMKVGDGCAAYHRTARRETPRALTPQQLTGRCPRKTEKHPGH